MGQAKSKKQFSIKCFNLLKQVGIAWQRNELTSDKLSDIHAEWGESLFNIQDRDIQQLNHTTQLRCLTHLDPDIRYGAEAYLNAALGYNLAQGREGLVIGLVCDVEPQHCDIVSEFDSMDPLKAWACQHLGIPLESLTLSTSVVLPDACITTFDSVPFLTRQLATGIPLIAPGVNERLGREPLVSSYSVVVYCHIHANQAEAFPRILAEIGNESFDDNNAPSVAMSYSLATVPSSWPATVTPLFFDQAYSVLSKNIFIAQELRIEDALADAEESGVNFEDIGIFLREGYPSYSDDNTPRLFVELRQISTKKTLAQLFWCLHEHRSLGVKAFEAFVNRIPKAKFDILNLHR